MHVGALHGVERHWALVAGEASGLGKRTAREPSDQTVATHL